jgi:hypothetical protein
MEKKKKTVVVNVFCAIETRKSSCAAWLYSQLLMKGYSCKYIGGIYGDCVYDSNILYTLGERVKAINSVYGDVDFIICECPIIGECVDCCERVSSSLESVIMEAFNSYDNFNVVVKADGAHKPLSDVMFECLDKKNIGYVSFDYNEKGYNSLLDTIIVQGKVNEEMSEKRPFLSSRNVIQILTQYTLFKGYRFYVDSLVGTEWFYVFSAGKCDYVVRFSYAPCCVSSWNDFLGDDREKSFVSYVITDDNKPFERRYKEIDENGVRYREVYFSTVLDDEQQLVKVEESIRDLVNSDVNEKLLLVNEGTNLEVVGHGYCTVISTDTVYNPINFAPIKIVNVRDAKGNVFRVSDPQNDILSIYND